MVPAIWAEPIVSGLFRNQLSPEMKGMILAEEMNCVACHQSDAEFANRSKKAPRLLHIGSRVNASYIEAFIKNPHQTKPGTTMPDVLAGKGEEERAKIAQSITHYLLSLGNNDFNPEIPDVIAAKRGRELFHMRGCVACHAPRDDKGLELLSEASVPLGQLHKKYSKKSLAAFLKNPHAVRPSGRMPRLDLPSRELQDIVDYLLQDTKVPGNLHYTMYEGTVWEGIDSDGVKATKAGHVKDFELESLGKAPRGYALEYEGWLNITKPGDYTFFATMNGGSFVIDGKELFSEKPSQQRRPQEFKGKIKLDVGRKKLKMLYYHAGAKRMFSFQMEGPGLKRGPVPSELLSVSQQPMARYQPLQIDPVLAEQGSQHFTMLGCANCHNDVKAEVDPNMFMAFAKLEPDQGCLSAESQANVPNYGFSAEQREQIGRFLPLASKGRLTAKGNIYRTLTSLNCTACHDREGLGKIDMARSAHFTGTHPELGDQGRIPPSLSHVGAKLTPEWIQGVLLEGKTQRGYINTRMPQYGAENVEHLVKLFGEVDKLEDVKIPKISNIRESKRAGYQMMGSKGFTCIACHDFNGKNPAGAGALDLAPVTQRLQKNWFHLFMRNPSRFHTTGIMPSFWPGGQSIRPDVLDGDVGQQIEALWAYLEDGPRAKKPEGLMRQADEVRVFDKAEMVRGRGTSAGFRAIGVGYPERVNLAFDSEEMALRILWKGNFAKVNHGRFNVHGTDRINFPKGIPFHRLKSLDVHWPYKAKTNYRFPHDHGYQFRGYKLDALRRPTFHYFYGDVRVEDFFEAIEKEQGKAIFRRTFRFETPSAQKMFYFRAASGAHITKVSGGEYKVDKLHLRIVSGQGAIVREGDPGDVLIPLELPQGQSSLILEYQW